MATMMNGRTTLNSTFRFGWTAKVFSLVTLTLFLLTSCSQHYCPTYSSTTYNKSFDYAAEKYLTYKPVKVHEFRNAKLTKSDKKEKKTKVR